MVFRTFLRQGCGSSFGSVPQGECSIQHHCWTLHHLVQRTICPLQAASVSFSVAVHGACSHCALTISPCVCLNADTRYLHYQDKNKQTYPSITLLGVAAPDAEAGVDDGAKRPKLPPEASRSFCSSASARRLRKSERWTRPTVCDARRSAAVEA